MANHQQSTTAGSKPKPRRQRSAEALRDISKHVHYEVWMLQSLAEELGAGKQMSQPIHNAMLEAFVIHVRAVMDFLYAGPNLKPDDVIAKDFLVGNVEWEKERPAPTPNLTIARRRVGKEIAHLTFERLIVTEEEKAWRFLDISRDVAEVLRVFLKHVPLENLADEWRNAA